ncbi:MAG: hypothetical protein IJR71_09265 [Prevotella sp.]|nr:hypothetical protein [Prevotella sp.]
MKSEDKKKVANTLTEAKVPFRVGIMRFNLRQPTLAQIYEMGAEAVNIEEGDLPDKVDKNLKVNVMAEIIAHHKDAAVMQKVFLILLFRSKWKRRFWKRYILRRLTVDMFNEMVGIVSATLNINFFLTSIIFLKQTTAVTEPKSTTAPGQPSEE